MLTEVEWFLVIELTKLHTKDDGDDTDIITKSELSSTEFWSF